MDFEVPDRVHVAPLGVERDRIVEPPVEYGADLVVLLDYLPAYVEERPAVADIGDALSAAGIDHEVREVEVGDLFDAMAAVGEAILDHDDDEVYVNLATGDKVVAIGAMIACMATGEARPYYVEAEQYGSHRGPIPRGVRSVDAIPPYPMDRPERQHLEVMCAVADSDRQSADGEPYRIKRELIDFGEREGLPFVADYDGDTEKGKFRRLDAHVLDPLEERGYVEVREVGTQRWVTLTEDGYNTLRAFRYLVE